MTLKTLKNNPKKLHKRQLVVFFLCSPNCPKQPRTSFPFYKFFIQSYLPRSLITYFVIQIWEIYSTICYFFMWLTSWQNVTVAYSTAQTFITVGILVSREIKTFALGCAIGGVFSEIWCNNIHSCSKCKIVLIKKLGSKTYYFTLLLWFCKVVKILGW